MTVKERKEKIYAGKWIDKHADVIIGLCQK